MRLFIALEFDKATQAFFSECRDLLEDHAETGTFVLDGNFHATLHFLGDVDPTRLEAIQRAMADVRLAPLTLELERIGFFAPRRPGKIYWVGIGQDDELERIHKELHRSLERSGFKLDRRPFRGHVTIARRVEIAEDEEKALKEAFEPRVTNPRAITLMQSERVAGRMVYTPLYKRKF